MKNTVKIIALLFVMAITLSACGGSGGSDLTADSPVDFKMSMNDFDKVEKSEKDKYEGKVVEITGSVKKTAKSHPQDAGSGEWFIHLKGESDGGLPPEVTCFFSADQAAHQDKSVTVKGKVAFYEFSDGAFLTGCLLTAN